MSDSRSDGCFAAILVFLIGLPLSCLLYAEAVMLNWNWFATTLGAPHIGFVQAYGLSMVVSSFRGGGDDKKDERALLEIVVSMLVHTIMRFAVIAGMGWATHAILVSQ